jgi:hypothetical protein
VLRDVLCSLFRMPQNAPEWFELQNKRALGQFILGDKHKFEYGKGVAKDSAEAVRLTTPLEAAALYWKSRRSRSRRRGLVLCVYSTGTGSWLCLMPPPRSGDFGRGKAGETVPRAASFVIRYAGLVLSQHISGLFVGRRLSLPQSAARVLLAYHLSLLHTTRTL